MSPRRLCLCLASLAVLALSGCGYVHVGRLPQPVTNVVGDEKLLKENSDLRVEKKLLQQELALTRAQGDALRSTIENRAADGDTTRRVADKLAETARDLAALRASYAQLQTLRAAQTANPTEVADLKAKLVGTEEKLAASLRNFTQLQEEVTGLRNEVTKARTENLVLVDQVKVVTAKNLDFQLALAQLNSDLLSQKETRARIEQDALTLRTQLAEANTRVSTLAQQRTAAAGEARALSPGGETVPAVESPELRAQLDSLRAQVSALQAERTSLQQQLAAKNPDLADTKALADTQAKLIAALNGAKMLRDENEQLKTTATQLEGELVQAKSAAPLAAQAQSLRDQLAQTQAQAKALADENSQLKSRLNSTAVRALASSGSPAAPTATPNVQQTGSPVTATFVISTPSAPSSSITRSTPSASAPRYHTVANGDTLSKISAQYYGTPGRWAEILVANRDVLGEDNNLVIGRQLRIP